MNNFNFNAINQTAIDAAGDWRNPLDRAGPKYKKIFMCFARDFRKLADMMTANQIDVTLLVYGLLYVAHVLFDRPVLGLAYAHVRPNVLIGSRSVANVLNTIDNRMFELISRE